MLDTDIPDLTLQGLPLGPKQISYDLRCLLYQGAASTFQPIVQKAIESGQFGQPLLERLPFLVAIHRRWQADVAAKKLSVRTVDGLWFSLRGFVAFAERAKRCVTIAVALDLYLAFCAHTKRRTDLKAASQYSYSLRLAQIIAPVLELDSSKLQWKSKIRPPKRLGNSSAKENLQDTASFVQTLLETIEQLPVDVIRGPLPVVLHYAAGGEYTIHCGAPLRPMNRLKSRRDFHRKREMDRRELRANDQSNKARRQVVNLRLDAEMLVLINQTAGNLTQVLQLTGSDYRYRSDGDHLHLSVWKNRAKHEVQLRIHKAYRKHFEAYLKWRSAIFPGDPDGLTFPFVCNDGDIAMQRTKWPFRDARKLMAAIGQPFVHSNQLRKTYANFWKRKLSRQIAAELLGNTEQTFRKNYEEVHHQVAVAELVNFWSETEALVMAVGPGSCQQTTPQLRLDAPDGAPMPDCESGGACLFCDKNRDIRSFDHAWNLTSLHHLKLAELNADRTPLSRKASHPAALTVERIAAKLDAMMALWGDCAEWVVEARLRVQEGRYHPFYTAAFNLMDGA